VRLNALGTHLLLELRSCDAQLLDNYEFIKQAMLEAALKAGATIIGQTFHKFHPIGVTGVVAISESHMSIHTWPEYGYAAVDVFTCGEAFNPHVAAQILVERLQCKLPSTTEVKRGIGVASTLAMAAAS